jgi:hypothetical protein
MKSVFPILILMILGVSCLDEPDCIGLHNNVVGITIKSYDDHTALLSKIDSVITIRDNVKIIVAKAIASQSYLAVPVNYLKDQTTYQIYLEGNKVAQNIVLSYESQKQFITTECGPRFQLASLTVTQHDFDSISVVNPTPGAASGTKNIEIFTTK